MMRHGKALGVMLAILGIGAMAGTLHAAPYASGVVKSGTSVSFILNETADSLTYTINGGAPQALSGATIGLKNFSLTNPNDTFSIIATKNDAVGYTIPTGETVFNVDDPNDTAPGTEADLIDGTHGLAVPVPGAGFKLVSDDANVVTRFNSPRGVEVSTNPNAPNFGTAYVGNSQVSATFAPRNMAAGDGIFAIRADGADAYGQGNVAANPMFGSLPTFPSGQASSPYRMFVGPDGTVYAADWSNANGGVYALPPNLSSAINVLDGFGDVGVPSGQNHGSVAAVHVEGSLATGDLNVYTIDEDITTATLTGGGSSTDQNSLWHYAIGSGPLPYAADPVRISDVAIPVSNSDVSRGADGKWYITQSRFDVDNSPSLFVVSADGSSVLFNSLQATRVLQQDPAATSDILQYVTASDVAPDQSFIALMLNGSDVAILPLNDDGIPILADLSVVKSTVDYELEFSGRDISIDAAHNIHYVSSGQGRYRVIAPGGETTTTLTWNGTDYDFAFVGGSAPALDDADFDSDGDVDGADFLTWQRGLGPGDQADGDANGDNVVNGADLQIWKDQFVNATPVAASVPEPSTWALAALTCAVCVAAASPRRRAALARVKGA